MNSFFSKYKYPLLTIAFMLLVGGFFSYRNLKTGLFPDITFPKIKVIADAGQQPVDKMMTTVTIPLENIIRQLHPEYLTLPLSVERIKNIRLS